MRPREDLIPSIEVSPPRVGLWDWVHDNHQKAFLGGTVLLSGLASLLAPRGRRWERFSRLWAGTLALGAALDPLVNPASSGYGHVWARGPRTGRRLALTFDDGPEPPYTERVLDILGEFRVKATFFLVGRQVEAHPELARRILAEGHLVGNHTFAHKNLLLCGSEEGRRDIAEGAAAIERVTGVWPQWFRPPMGFRYPWNLRQAARLGQATVTWSCNPRDFEFPSPDTLLSRVVAGARPGDIVLLHDGMRDQSNTVAALPAMIRELQKREFELVRVDQLVAGS